MTDLRSDQARVWRRWYQTARWRRIRLRQLGVQPLCERCKSKGFLITATICDHADPKAKETEAGFFAGPFVSLCKPCHDGPKQSEEKTGKKTDSIGYSKAVDANGFPTDPRHPWYAKQH